VLRCGAQVGGLTLWVRRTDAVGARYAALRDVDTHLTVDEFIARWVGQEKLNVTPSLVSLRLVHRGPAKLTKDPAERKAAEEAATVLDPADTLEEAGVADGSWLLAVVIEASGASTFAPLPVLFTPRLYLNVCSLWDCLARTAEQACSRACGGRVGRLRACPCPDALQRRHVHSGGCSPHLGRAVAVAVCR